jgi:hypothetical protein
MNNGLSLFLIELREEETSMTVLLNAETTVAHAFHDNAALHDVTKAEQAWRDVMSAISASNPHTKKMHLLNLESDADVFKAQFIAELSDDNLAKTNLSYDIGEQELLVASVLDLSGDGHGLMSSEWKTVEEGQERRFGGDYTLQDIGESILSSNTEMAYEALHRANSAISPMQPSMDMLRKLEQSI